MTTEGGAYREQYHPGNGPPFATLGGHDGEHTKKLDRLDATGTLVCGPAERLPAPTIRLTLDRF